MAMVDIAAAEGGAFVISAATSQLGKLMISLASDMNLKVIGLVRRVEAIEPLKELGATEVLVTSNPDFVTRFTEVCHNHKPRIYLDAVSDQISETVFTLMPNNARWICYGILGTTAPALTQMGQFIFMGKRIEGFWLRNWMLDTPPADQARVVNEVQARFADGRWKTDIAVTLRLNEAIEGLASATKLTDGKVIITP